MTNFSSDRLVDEIKLSNSLVRRAIEKYIFPRGDDHAHSLEQTRSAKSEVVSVTSYD